MLGPLSSQGEPKTPQPLCVLSFGVGLVLCVPGGTVVGETGLLLARQPGRDRHGIIVDDWRLVLASRCCCSTTRKNATPDQWFLDVRDASHRSKVRPGFDRYLGLDLGRFKCVAPCSMAPQMWYQFDRSGMGIATHGC